MSWIPQNATPSTIIYLMNETVLVCLNIVCWLRLCLGKIKKKFANICMQNILQPVCHTPECQAGGTGELGLGEETF